ncbi:flavin-dependent oxidoreductase [Spongiactinospora sp. TRM90649]|uniref:flavin-dependent oxidoreductase n=1 Tax=Spongiactinospora sp. TRM90649 TaxID=3031114 RepID=UPI0023F9CC82|nr:flavin-dependent oxidoreductase [Spongiactinospora sp. TRM90649]MDF5752694.1 flavin-dependent oxidoreductase [Spongiactinospora sp. TRM90649]
MHVMIVGAGIGGLATALSLHAAGVDCVVVEAAAELGPLGVGINLQPHAVRELTELGLGPALAATGIATTYMTFTDRYGGTILATRRGLDAGYLWPQYSIHRGELQMLLLAAVRERLGHDRVRTGLAFEDFDQDATGVTALLRDVRSGEKREERADLLVGADGVNSVVRARLHPDEGPMQWGGIRMWRGVAADQDEYLDGSTVIVAGSNLSAKFVAYPISAREGARGRATVNWVAEVKLHDPGPAPVADWSKAGSADDVLPHFAGFRLPWLDVSGLIRATDRILEYPMVDRDPLPRWGSGRVTLLGDAAHPMYPIGANGGSQAVLDARFLARSLAVRAPNVSAALDDYEGERREPTGKLVLAHRELPMEETISKVQERAPDGFADIADVLTPAELADMSVVMKRITDMDVRTLNERPSWAVG